MKEKCDCSKCFYGLRHLTEGCTIYGETLEERIEKSEKVRTKKEMCSSFPIGNKLYKKYLKEQTYGGMSPYDYVAEQPIDERYKYLPQDYDEKPSICIGSTTTDKFCKFRKDGHVQYGCEYCYKKYGTCHLELQRETTIYEVNKREQDRSKRLIHILIDIMIKLGIIIVILLILL